MRRLGLVILGAAFVWAGRSMAADSHRTVFTVLVVLAGLALFFSGCFWMMVSR